MRGREPDAATTRPHSGSEWPGSARILTLGGERAGLRFDAQERELRGHSARSMIIAAEIVSPI